MNELNTPEYPVLRAKHFAGLMTLWATVAMIVIALAGILTGKAHGQEIVLPVPAREAQTEGAVVLPVPGSAVRADARDCGCGCGAPGCPGGKDCRCEAGPTKVTVDGVEVDLAPVCRGRKSSATAAVGVEVQAVQFAGPQVAVQAAPVAAVAGPVSSPAARRMMIDGKLYDCYEVATAAPAPVQAAPAPITYAEPAPTYYPQAFMPYAGIGIQGGGCANGQCGVSRTTTYTRWR